MRQAVGIVTGSAEARALLAQLPEARALAPGARLPEDLTAVIDARHPCDRAGHWALWRAARARALPLLRLERPGYVPRPGARWIRVRDMAQALRHLPQGARVFATTGGEDYATLARWRGHLVLRRRGGAGGRPPVRGARVLTAPGPFDVAGERALMQRLGVTHLITRDAGGSGSWPKIEAARRLGVTVILMSRGPAPPGPRARTPEEALSWLRSAASS
ncbi:precorrin-6A/cobalt-precorrin-6A reductase [Roseivivax sp. GX 12232]|uniref:precorrin-6A/cobalt-precorrin-6A reductase n=1 Tax=Roseivivax sp. GX 12232 TaxID=2900547 RepID=UPI001E40549B|nr:precorrin-6A/cobalt-precorrin-6A reductase [Roseivivax sp. GX 12232]MCE0504610.1 precorrin-6A/cobalt-precorrin-6A reductase [Roseivivax sp. GX 12232]